MKSTHFSLSHSHCQWQLIFAVAFVSSADQNQGVVQTFEKNSGEVVMPLRSVVAAVEVEEILAAHWLATVEWLLCFVVAVVVVGVAVVGADV